MKLRPGLAALGHVDPLQPEGARQLRRDARALGWELIEVPLPGYTIHLDGHLAMVDEDLALIDAGGLPFDFLERLHAEGIETIHVDPGEASGRMNAARARARGAC